MYFLVFLYSRRITSHIPWRFVTSACLSFIQLCTAPVQPFIDSYKNYCKVLVMIFCRGHCESIPDKSNKKRQQALKEYLTRDALKGDYSSASQKRESSLQNRQISLLFLFHTILHDKSSCTKHNWVSKAESFYPCVIRK